MNLMQKKDTESNGSIKGCVFSLFVFMLVLIFFPFAMLSFAVSPDGYVGWFVGGLSASFLGLILQIFRIGSRPLEKWTLWNRYLVAISVGLIVGGVITAVSTQMIGAIVGGVMATFWGYWLLPATNWLKSYFDKHPLIGKIIFKISEAMLFSFLIYEIILPHFLDLDSGFVISYFIGIVFLSSSLIFIMDGIWWGLPIFEGIIAGYYLMSKEEFNDWFEQSFVRFGELPVRLIIISIFISLFLFIAYRIENKKDEKGVE